MKTLFTLLLTIITLSAFSQKRQAYQDDLYYQPNTSRKIDSISNSLQANLFRYHKERQTAFMLTISGVLLSTASMVITEEPKVQQVTAIAGGVIGITGYIVLIDAEKWLKRASLSIGPGSVKINF